LFVVGGREEKGKGREEKGKEKRIISFDMFGYWKERKEEERIIYKSLFFGFFNIFRKLIKNNYKNIFKFKRPWGWDPFSCFKGDLISF
jgi:hypothetical protein